MNITNIKRYNGLILILGLFLLGCSLYFDKGILIFQITGIVFLMFAAYLFSLKRNDENIDEDE